ncbi:nicotinamidase [Boudabousia liubingyangii]|uniref:nicotinamidase n=1 Tax=Boudabousia liubingyangii TaxID=1921764 RepID=A0A1Q5PJL2_9ACTO|nr:isochorismatase family protein [Boudabousia liubingyangii]OKL46115.1 nicotinamidase [Boudabousia liubingyangii]OKL46258.1 nicotinamidase [Boudabousia liubingyangii]
MKKALLVVDVQPTFCEGGALGVTGGNDTAQGVADFLAAHAKDYDLVVSTQDWHIEPGDHFSEHPDFVDTWPPHGVAGTPEAELHPLIADFPFDAQVRKGQYAAAYSGFEGVTDDGRTLTEVLHKAAIDQVDVVGIALSHCVRDTALDSLHRGWPTTVFTDLSVPVSKELGDEAVALMAAEGVTLEHSPA